MTQPDPIPNHYPAVWDLVLSDLACPPNPLLHGRMQERDRIGLERYGVRLQPHNGRDAHGDALDEVLDLRRDVR